LLPRFVPILVKMGANIVIERPADDRAVEEWAILGNSMAWRRRMLFSQEAGDRGFSLQAVIISITLVGCYIDREATVPFWTFCLFGRRDRH